MGDPVVGQRIREARQAAELTQSELAARIGLAHPQSVSNYERGIDEPDIARLRRIAEATSLPLEFFVETATAPASAALDHSPLLERLLRELLELREGQDEIARRLERLEAQPVPPTRRREAG